MGAAAGQVFGVTAVHKWIAYDRSYTFAVGFPYVRMKTARNCDGSDGLAT